MSRIISDYCKQDVEGWNILPDILPNFTNSNMPNKEISFLRIVDGVHLMASIKNYGDMECIHVSLAPIRTLRKDWTEEDHIGHIFDIAYEVIKSFFGAKQFLRKPDSPDHPLVKHYFYVFDNE